ncbi:peptide ABC transporter permease [Thioalkalivibrio denitrificans]|uniref:Peptide ABC transporter permease n=1 Tax=Thioalkalivibrio denitrificans TaxID=108003 RepID=A0A1V3N9L6_9GAMM|nr:ABC transporter permease [Thioalkalivibrio denitrificans]OOG21797.1 peptide ABC transporter permease [Thioalkalivibrio denitrificans]
MAIVRLALCSLRNRWVTATLTLFAIGFSVALLLAVEKLRTETRASFAHTISGTDLVVGARGGSVQLLLYSVFRIGGATHNISWESYQDIRNHPRIAWTIPLSLGDSHRGYPVMGTNLDYFRHYRFGREQSLQFEAGGPFNDLFDVVLGAEVAHRLGYELGDMIVIAHGTGKVAFLEHDDMPFRVAGILKRTGTPVDRTLHISLDGMEAIHVDWHGGTPPPPGRRLSPGEVRQVDLTPRSITAFLVGLDSRAATFQVQRHVNGYRQEPMLAILPGVALHELWSLMGVAEQALLLVSGAVVAVGLIGTLAVMLAGLNERRREMAILRSVGARPRQIFLLLVSETLALALAGIVAGLGMLYLSLHLVQPVVQSRFGIRLAVTAPGWHELALLSLFLAAALLVSLIPAYRAYRNSLADGLNPRI